MCIFEFIVVESVSKLFFPLLPRNKKMLVTYKEKVIAKTTQLVYLARL